MPPQAIAIDLGGTAIKAALVQSGGHLRHEQSVPTNADEGPDAVLDRIAALVSGLWIDGVEGVGIGVPGAVDSAQRYVVRPPNLPGWDRVDVSAELGRRLDREVRVVVENDANAAALGSAHYGAGRDFRAFLMATLGTGVGGAIVIDGVIFRGAHGGAGEFGHVSVDYEGPVDGAGVAGAAEAYVGQEFLTARARQLLPSHPESALHDVQAADLSPLHLTLAADAGDALAADVLAWAGHKLGCALASVVHVLDIRKIVVGGGVSGAGAWLLDPAREALLRQTMPALRDGLEIVAETMGNDAGLLGAAHPLLG